MLPDSLKVRKDPTDVAVNSGCTMDTCVESPLQIDTGPRSHNAANLRRSLRRRSEVHYGLFDITSKRESDCIQPTKALHWHPEDSCRPIIDEAPTFYPTEEEFKDALAYIAKIRQTAEPFGICRVIPPPSWKPTCPLKEKNVWDCAKFTTRIQQIDRLQNRDPARKRTRVQRRRKRRRRFRLGMNQMHADVDAFENDCAGADTDEKFGFQMGSDFTLRTFQEFADCFKESYFMMNDVERSANSSSEESRKIWKPSIEEIEGEYWRIVEKSTEEMEVHYGADLETGRFGSGFSKANLPAGLEPDPQALSGWNLNNFPRLSGSLLSFEASDISGVLVPWLYVGMCFSSFCWHVEDHHLYSLNYMHFGDPKVWYGVAGGDAVKLEEAMKKCLPKLFEEQPHLLNELVTQLSPAVLKSEGVPVYRAVQNSGEFLLTFPRAYHAGFNCGFNCAEAVNVAPMDWLPHGQCAVEHYSKQCRKTSLSHDKLLLGAALEAVKYLWDLQISDISDISEWRNVCGKNGVLSKAIKERIIMEKQRMERLPVQIQSRRINKKFDSDERECIFCFYDLYMSATGCACSPNQYTCWNHMETLCSCQPSSKFLFFRYDMDELDTLLEALQGDLKALKKWVLKGYCAQNMEQSEMKVDKTVSVEVITGNAGDQMDELCCFREEFLPVKETLKCEDGFLFETNRSNYREIDRKCMDILQGPTFPSNFDATYSKSCMKDVGERYTDTSFDLNSDGSCMEIVEVWQQHHEGEKREYISCVSGMNTSTINVGKGPVINLLENASHREIIKVDIPSVSSLCGDLLQCPYPVAEQICKNDAIPKDENNLSGELLQWPCHVVEQRIKNAAALSRRDSADLAGLDLFQYRNSNAISLRHSADLAGLEIFQTRDSNGTTCSGSGASCRKSKSTKFFGFDIQLLQQGSVKDDLATDSSDYYDTEIDLNQSADDSMPEVELLELGKVVPGEMWCSRESIFPKGFKSRVRFTSVLNPCQTCNYISEVLSGVLVPIFKVTVEDSPLISFTCTSPALCWELVQRNLEEKLMTSCEDGHSKFHDIGSIDGLEMFGFLSQSIVQAIEALDPHHCCTEYWQSKADRRLEQRVSTFSPLGSTEQSNGNLITDDEGGVSTAMQSKLFGVDLLQIKTPCLDPISNKEVNQVPGGLDQQCKPPRIGNVARYLPGIGITWEHRIPKASGQQRRE